MKQHIFLLCLAVGHILAQDCLMEGVRIKGKLLTKERTKENSPEDCLDRCLASEGCLAFNYVKKKKGGKCSLFKKIKKTMPKTNIISAIISEYVECIDSTPPVTDFTPPVTDFTPPVTDSIPPLNDTIPPVTDSTPPVTDSTANPTDATCKCGVKKQGTRIVGGDEAEVNEYPWMVYLSMGCGGSVIADRWILTAAHCVDFIKDPQDITVTLGEHDRSITTDSLITKAVTPDKIVIHESYGSLGNAYDIALLRLPTDIDLDIYTPVCLPDQGQDYTDEKVWVYGWGTLASNGALPNILQELEIKVLSDDVGNTNFGLTDTKLETMVFAGGEAGKDACQGDSGGPLSYDNNGQHELVGATSWGYGCANAGYPGVYTEISNFRDWINTNIGEANTC